MSREILFKAKRANGEWIEGDLYHGGNYCAIHNDQNKDYDADGIPILLTPVDPSTVCQYTGLTDENGKKIFEGDILEGRWDDKHPEDVTRAVVEWILFGWYIHEIGKSLPDEMDESDIDIWTVCGNVWDNPELLEGGTGEDD